MSESRIELLPRMECPACHAWSDREQRLRAQIRRQRIELRNLNRAHRMMWKVLQLHLDHITGKRAEPPVQEGGA